MLAYFHSLSILDNREAVCEAKILTVEACGGIKSIRLQDHLTKHQAERSRLRGSKQVGSNRTEDIRETKTRDSKPCKCVGGVSLDFFSKAFVVMRREMRGRG